MYMCMYICVYIYVYIYVYVYIYKVSKPKLKGNFRKKILRKI